MIPFSPGDIAHLRAGYLSELYPNDRRGLHHEVADAFDREVTACEPPTPRLADDFRLWVVTLLTEEEAECCHPTARDFGDYLGQRVLRQLIDQDGIEIFWRVENEACRDTHSHMLALGGADRMLTEFRARLFPRQIGCPLGPVDILRDTPEVRHPDRVRFLASQVFNNYRRFYRARLAAGAWWPVLHDEPESLQSATPDPDDHEAVSGQAEESLDRVRRLLTVEEMELLTRYLVNEETMASIAASLGITPAAGYGRIARIRKRIRDEFGSR